MKAPVFGVLILRLARGAHSEVRHGGRDAVIRYIADDGVARAAMGAIGEWIAVAAIRRVAKIAPASVARASVGGDQRKFAGLVVAAKNGKARAPLYFDFGDRDLGDFRELRRFFFQGLEKVFNFRSAAFDFDSYARG